MADYPLKLDYLQTLTDDTGLLQHAKYGIPTRKEGYCTDDNARALVVCTNHFMLYRKPEAQKLARVYLSFLFHMQREDGRMRNFLGYNRQFLDEVGSEDCMGHTLWACGRCMDSDLPHGYRLVSREIFDKLIPKALLFPSPRAQALSSMGLFHYGRAVPNDTSVPSDIRILADRLLKDFEENSSEEWQWFEPYLTYANGRLPHALYLAYQTTHEPKYLEVASESLDFLLRNQITHERFMPIGNRGWYNKGSDRAVYDQQSIEACCLVEAAVLAFQTTRKHRYLRAAEDIFSWYLGKNVKAAKLYDEATGSCCDGLTPDGVNLNMGAEATLAYLQACLILRSVKSKKSLP